MAKKNPKNDLGKGIRALLGDDSGQNLAKPSTAIEEIAVSKIEINPFQPRVEFDEEHLSELAQSIKTYGLIQPVTLRKMGPKAYQIISGERRFRASKKIGLKSIPAYIRTADDQLMLEMALVENIQRADLNAMEIAISYRRLIDECNLTHESMADRVGKKRSSITNYLRLLDLPPQIQQGIKEQKVSMGHARALAGIDDIAVQLSVYGEILSKDLSVRAAENLIRSFKESGSTKKAPPPSSIPSEYLKVKTDLEHKLETRIKLKVDDAGKGSIQIPFANTKDLNRLLDILDV